MTSTDLATLLSDQSVDGGSIKLLSTDYAEFSADQPLGVLGDLLAPLFLRVMTNMTLAFTDDPLTQAGMGRVFAWFTQYMYKRWNPTGDPVAFGEIVYTADADSLQHTACIAAVGGESPYLQAFAPNVGVDGDGNPTFTIDEISLSGGEWVGAVLVRF